MIAAELRGGSKPSLNEALEWIGSRVDDIYGASVGRLEDVWIDPGTGSPRWLLVTEGRFGGRSTLIPFEDATAGAGHIWVPYERDVVRGAPEVQPGAPLTQELEASLRAHYATISQRSVTGPASRERRDGGAASRAEAPRMPERPAPPVEAPAEREELVYRPASERSDSPREAPEGADDLRYDAPARRTGPSGDSGGEVALGDGSQSVEIEFSGELTIRGEIRSIRLRPGGARPADETSG